MVYRRFSTPDHIPLEDWNNTPESVQQFVESLFASIRLSADESRLIQFLDATPIGIAIRDDTGQLTYINQMGREILGMGHGAHPGQIQWVASLEIFQEGTQQLYPVERLPDVRALRGETAWADDLEIHLADRVLSLEVWATPIFDEQEQVVHTIAAFQDITERKQLAANQQRHDLERQIVANTLAQSEQRYRQVIQAQTDLILRSQADTTITFANDALCHALGLPLEAVLGLKWCSFVPPAEVGTIHEKIAALSPEHPIFENINQDYRANQQIGWTQWINLGIFSDRGELVEIQSVGRDVTALQAQILREQALNRVFQAVRNSLEIETIFATATTETTQLLSLDCRVVQYLPDQGIWRILAECRHRLDSCGMIGREIPDQQNPFSNSLKQLHRVRVEATQLEDSDPLKDGVNRDGTQVFPGAWLMIPMAIDGNLWGCFTVSTTHLSSPWQDEQVNLAQSVADQLVIAIQQANLYQQVQLELDERRRIESALRDSETRYRLLAENMNDLVCLHDLQGRYLYVSPSCEALLGYRYNEMLGQDPYTFFHPDDRDRVYAESHMAALSGKPTPITYRIRQKSGNYIWFETLTKPILNATGQMVQLQTTSRDVTTRIEVQHQLAHGALHDALTGLPNRQLLMERLELAINRAQRLDHYRFAVIFLDLDRFKVINDSLGHLVGDQLLIAISQQLQSTLRSIDLVARLGGDEFVILLEEIGDIQEAVRATERILTLLQTPLRIEERQVYTTASIGIVLSTREYTQPSHLLRDADIAMYRAKSKGKARYEIFDTEMHRQALNRLHLENDLRRAIASQEFVLYYQPIVALKTGTLAGFEALIRWQHPTQGIVPPGTFIPIAEETGLITQLDFWALQTACHQLKTWQTRFANCSNLKVSVNLSVQDLHHPNLLQEVDRGLNQTGLPGHCLTLEITESMLIEDVESTITLLSRLKQRGIQISIDDFGTGYSSLNYLHRLPVDHLKVDRAFVNQIQTGNRNHQIVETIVALGRQLELETIAEGIETQQQLHRLRHLEYQFGQGYLFSKPLSQSATEALLISQPEFHRLFE